jgi:hypothetical protein
VTAVALVREDRAERREKVLRPSLVSLKQQSFQRTDAPRRQRGQPEQERPRRHIHVLPRAGDRDKWVTAMKTRSF